MRNWLACNNASVAIRSIGRCPRRGFCPRCLAAAALLDEPEPAPVSADEWHPSTLSAGRYRLGRKLGGGGFGTVYLADQLEPVKRKVAIKILRDDRISKEL